MEDNLKENKNKVMQITRMENISNNQRKTAEEDMVKLVMSALEDKNYADDKISKLHEKIGKEKAIKIFIREKQETIKQLNELYLQYETQLN